MSQISINVDNVLANAGNIPTLIRTLSNQLNTVTSVRQSLDPRILSSGGVAQQLDSTCQRLSDVINRLMNLQNFMQDSANEYRDTDNQLNKEFGVLNSQTQAVYNSLVEDTTTKKPAGGTEPWWDKLKDAIFDVGIDAYSTLTEGLSTVESNINAFYSEQEEKQEQESEEGKLDLDTDISLGAAKIVTGLLTGLGEAILHPVKTGENLLNAAEGLGIVGNDTEKETEFDNKIVQSVKSGWQSFENADINSKITTGTEAAGQIALLFTGAGEAADAVNAASDTSKVAEAAEDLGDAEKVAETTEKAETDISADAAGKTEFEANPFDENGNLKPNIKYKAGEYDYIYETDDKGRICKFETDDLQLTTRDTRLQHNPDTPGKLDGDHAGHLAGDRFGGSPDLDNIVSQSQNVNLSAYKKIENQWASALKEGKQVKVNVDIKYDGDSLRPSEFNVKYEIDGKKFTRSLLN